MCQCFAHQQRRLPRCDHEEVIGNPHPKGMSSKTEDQKKSASKTDSQVPSKTDDPKKKCLPRWMTKKKKKKCLPRRTTRCHPRRTTPKKSAFQDGRQRNKSKIKDAVRKSADVCVDWVPIVCLIHTLG